MAKAKAGPKKGKARRKRPARATAARPPPEALADILRGRFPANLPEPKPKSFVERAGAQHMTILLIVICGAAVLFMIAWAAGRPNQDDVKQFIDAVNASNPEQAVPLKDKFEMLRQLQQDHSEQYRNLFQVVVLSGLVPLFTLLAGYIFGKGQDSETKDDTT